MKKIWIGVIVLLLPIQFVSANTVVRSGDTVTMTENQSIEGSFYAVGGTVALSGKIEGDAVVIGGNVSINGEVSEDLAVLAGTVNVQGPIDQDVRIVAGQVTISDTVNGNLVVVAGKLNILSGAKITGDLLFYGDDATIQGSVDGKILGSAQTIRIDSAVKGGVDIKSGSLVVGELARIGGDLKYSSNQEAVRAPGAEITGKVIKSSDTGAVDNNTSNTFAKKTIAIMFLVSLFATLALYLVFRRLIEKFGRNVGTNFLLEAVTGFFVLTLAPLVILLLTISMLGAVVGVIVLFVYLLLLALTLPLMAVTAGRMSQKLMKDLEPISIQYLVLGAVVVNIILIVPILGGIIFLGFYLLTLGNLVICLFKVSR